MLKNRRLRVARPSSDLVATERFYCDALGLERLGGFENHEGFDGIMLGYPDSAYHLEFTAHRHSRLVPSPTEDDLLVFYIPAHNEWQEAVDRIESHGHRPVRSFNPYWDKSGRTYLDPDGYRVVIENGDSI